MIGNIATPDILMPENLAEQDLLFIFFLDTYAAFVKSSLKYFSDVGFCSSFES
jgi:hypothetical protein